MRINIGFKGLDEVLKDFSVKGLESRMRADKVTEKYTKKMANESAGRAPVLTGALRNSIASSPTKVQDASWHYGSKLPYARKQEYEHVSKKGFIRKSVWNNQDKYKEELGKELIK